MEMNQTHICSEKRDLYKTNRNDSHCLTHTHFLEKNSIGKTVVINGGLINVKVLQLFFKIYPYNWKTVIIGIVITGIFNMGLGGKKIGTKKFYPYKENSL